MAQRKPPSEPDPSSPAPEEQASAPENQSTAAGATGASAPGATTPAATTAVPTGNQILDGSWPASVDAQTAQQFNGLAQVRQARANQLQRQVTSLTAAYGANDPRVAAAQASLQAQQTYASRLGLAGATTSTAAPTAPANGWVVYGRVRNADLSAAPQLTVFLADQSRAWLKTYAYAFTDATGYFTLTYAPSAAAAKKARQAESKAPVLSAYLEISNAACKLMYMDTAPMSLEAGSVVYRDIVLAAEVPIGAPPCGPGASNATPPAKK